MRLTGFLKMWREHGFARRCVFCVLLCPLFIAIFTPVLPAEEARVKAEFRKYERIDADTILFKSGVGHGITLNDGEAVEFVIPEEFRGRLPNYSVIKHRKDPSFIDDPQAYDENSPWISVYYRDSGTGVWHVWQEVCILKTDGQRIELLKSANVGMAGWIVCGGPVDNYVTDNSDSLLISIENDVAMLMAYGISLSDAVM